MDNDGGSMVVLGALAQPVRDADVFLFDVDVERFGSGYNQFISVLMLRPGQALDLKAFPSTMLLKTSDGDQVLWGTLINKRTFASGKPMNDLAMTAKILNITYDCNPKQNRKYNLW